MTIYEDKEINRANLTLKIVAISLAIFFIIELIIVPFNYVHIALIVTFGFMIMLHLWLNQDTVQIINGLIIWSVTTLIFYLAWVDSGIYDTSLYAYPCVILFSMLMGSKILFLPLIISIFIQLFALMLAHEYNLIEVTSAAVLNHRLRTMDLALIFLLFYTFTYFFIRDFQQHIQQLTKEKNDCLAELSMTQTLLQYDPLSKLPNEHICYNEIAPLLTNTDNGHNNVAFMALDIINLREINNSFGYKIGDQLIIEIANRLTVMLQANEYIYRFTDKEFVLIKQSFDTNELEVFKERILQAIITEFNVAEYKISALCSIGIAIAPFDGNTIETLRSNAHLALQYSKTQQKNNAQYFKPSIKELLDNKYFYVAALKQAVINEEFTLYYQPKINLKTNAIIGVEALIRWQHPEKGWLAPDQFIPIAEESGLIVEITKFVIKQACKDCMEWQALGYANINVAINISAVDFKRGHLPKTIFNSLAYTGMSPHLLEIEITESTIFDDLEHIQSQIRQIQQKGISFAIDDFGTGYSNLGYLDKFNVSVLKIDRSFINKVARSEHEQHIVNAIIMMSKSLGIQNVAEGIEDYETAQWLKNAGCQIGQGYLWEKPLPLQELIQYFIHHPSKYNHATNIKLND